MNDHSAASTMGVQGPAAASAAMGNLDRQVRSIVRIAITQQSIAGGDPADAVAEWHDRLAKLLHGMSIEHGSEAVSTAAEYAIAMLESGQMYPGEELEAFLASVARSIRRTSREVAKGTPFGA